MAQNERRTVIVPAGMELSESDKEQIRAQLQGETVETIQGTRSEIAFSKEQFQTKQVEEVAKAKDLPIEKIKMS